MIGCTSARGGFLPALIHHNRQPDNRLPLLWNQAGYGSVGISEALIRIDEFSQSVSDSNQPACVFKTSKDGQSSASLTRLGTRLLSVLPMLGLFDSFHDYSEGPYAFLDACWHAESQFGIDLVVIGLNPAWAALHYARELNWLVDMIRMSARSDWYQRCTSDRIYKSRVRASKINGLVSGLLFQYSRLVLVRVDFGYWEGVREGVTMDRLLADRERLFELRKSHPVFAHLKGYVWAVEEGRTKGPHCHALFIFDGRHVAQDMSMGRCIRELWGREVTQGGGSSWCSNCRKERFDALGIGVIDRADPEACRNAVFFATYLAKDPHHPDQRDDPQYVRMRSPGARIFGTSQVECVSTRTGRPSIYPMAWRPEELQGLRWPVGPGGWA